MDCHLIKKQMKAIQLNKVSMEENGPCENTVTGIRMLEGQNLATVTQNFQGVWKGVYRWGFWMTVF